MGSRWSIRITELLLIGAAAAVAAATWVHWIPCQEAGTFSDACLARMDTGPAFPLTPEAAERTPLAVGLTLSALLLLSVALALVASFQPWRRPVRLAATVPALLTLVVAFQSVQPDPAAWTPAVAAGIELSAVPVLLAMIFGRDEAEPIHAVRRGLLLLAATGAGFFHLLFDFSLMVALSQANWDTPPGTGYLGALLIAAPAAASVVLGVANRPGHPPLAVLRPAAA